MLAVAGALGAVVLRAATEASKAEEAHAGEEYVIPARPELPFYSADDVARHTTRDSRIWVTYQTGVYDITEWVDLHPGGTAKIMLAAGKAIDPFWAMYASHKEKHIYEILEKYRIGNFIPPKEAAVDASDPYAHDPVRSPVLVVQQKKPFNAETPRELLTEYITPNDAFYVRNHLPVPVVNADEYVLTLSGEGLPTKTLTLAELQTHFPKYTVEATLQCAGNRRNEMSALKTVKGGSWDIGAISNAAWSGARLRDVLLWLGVDEEHHGLYHVQFEGLDRDMEKNYGASIPIEKALDKYGDVLLAYEMNGVALPRDHGYPVRAVVPGVVGARSVKWLGKVHVARDESPSHWQRNDYKSFSPNTDWDTVDFKTAPAIQEYPVQSAITEPKPNEAIALREGEDTLTVKGFAWAGGGRAIIRVDVTVDDGKTWTTAALEPSPSLEQPLPFGAYNREWAWRVWTAEVPLPKEKRGEVQVACRAWDTAYNTQPERTEHIWNLRGVVSNAWHRVPITVVDAKDE